MRALGTAEPREPQSAFRPPGYKKSPMSAHPAHPCDGTGARLSPAGDRNRLKSACLWRASPGRFSKRNVCRAEGCRTSPVMQGRFGHRSPPPARRARRWHGGARHRAFAPGQRVGAPWANALRFGKGDQFMYTLTCSCHWAGSCSTVEAQAAWSAIL